MRLNKNWRIDTSNDNCTLIFSEERIRKDGKDKGKTYVFEEPYYYATIPQCLKAFLNKSLEKSKDVEDCLKRIDLAMEEIKNLK